MNDYEQLMRVALAEAAEAAEGGDVPVGAVVVNASGEVVAAAHNQREAKADPTAHAEILALVEAARRAGTWRLDHHTLVVTLEPCPMCAGAAVNARLERIVYGAADPKAGACWSLYNIPQDARLNHRCELVQGVLAAECGELLARFFRAKRGDRTP